MAPTRFRSQETDAAEVQLRGHIPRLRLWQAVQCPAVSLPALPPHGPLPLARTLYQVPSCYHGELIIDLLLDTFGIIFSFNYGKFSNIKVENII